jgi:AraC-like DNA-binding protein
LAASRLADTGEPISTIAVEPGFPDQPHFTGAFAAYLGVTPRRYRELTRR